MTRDRRDDSGTQSMPTRSSSSPRWRYDAFRLIAARCGAGIGDDREARVVRDVQPLVRVGRPRIGACSMPVDLRAQLRHRGRPQPERAVDVHPARPCACARSTMRAERIAGAGADVAGLRADDQSDRSTLGERALRARPRACGPDRRPARGSSSSAPNPSSRSAPTAEMCTSPPAITRIARRPLQALRSRRSSRRGAAPRDAPPPGR